MPSNREGNPISILEAMSVGIPIIATSVGGIPDIVKEENGFLFNPNKLDEFLVIYFIFRKYLPLKGLIFVIVCLGILYMFKYPIYGNRLVSYEINIYSDGLINGSFIVARVLILIMFTTILTLTTKPTELNDGIESLLSPLEKIHIKTSIFAMMISIALRFIPTLFLEAEKILKAQASRGVDFNEGKLKDKIVNYCDFDVSDSTVKWSTKGDILAICGLNRNPKKSRSYCLYFVEAEKFNTADPDLHRGGASVHRRSPAACPAAEAGPGHRQRRRDTQRHTHPFQKDQE